MTTAIVLPGSEQQGLVEQFASLPSPSHFRTNFEYRVNSGHREFVELPALGIELFE
jgi:hypothetical protein